MQTRKENENKRKINKMMRKNLDKVLKKMR
jgi:hypothetical protein